MAFPHKLTKEQMAKGGRAKSKAKSRANLLKGLKTAKEETIRKRALELVLDPEASATQIFQMINLLKDNKTLTNRDRVALTNVSVNAHKAIHGEIRKNLNVNVETGFEIEVERISKFLEENEIRVKRNSKINS